MRISAPCRCEVLGRHVQDAVVVDVERHLDLRHAARRRRDAFQIELAEQTVAGAVHQLALALEDADGHRRLIVLGRREGLLAFRRDRRVALHQARHHAAQRLDAERQRRHVEQQHSDLLPSISCAPWMAAPMATTSSGFTPCGLPCRRPP